MKCDKWQLEVSLEPPEIRAKNGFFEVIVVNLFILKQDGAREDPDGVRRWNRDNAKLKEISCWALLIAY